MGGVLGWDGAQAHACEQALVFEEPPDLPPNGGVVAVLPPPALCSVALSRALERAQALDGHQRAPMDATQQEDGVARQVRQSPVAGVILSPTSGLLIQKRLDAARRPAALGVILREGVAFLLEPAHLFLEVVDLAAGAGLAPIEATRVEEEGRPTCWLFSSTSAAATAVAVIKVCTPQSTPSARSRMA